MNENFIQYSLYGDIIDFIDASQDFNELNKSLMIQFLNKIYQKYEAVMAEKNDIQTLLEQAQKLQALLSYNEATTKMAMAFELAQDMFIQMLGQQIKEMVAA
jgi:hypothetical protein